MDIAAATGRGASAYTARNKATESSGNTAAAQSNIDAVFEEENKEVSVDNFLQLMIAQLKNQDFMNPMDDTQYVTQLAQFATMQQMQELAYYNKSNYVMSLIGNDVTVAKLGIGGEVEKQTGPIEKISFYQDEYYIHVGGKAYTLNQLMEVNSKSVSDQASDEIDVSDKAVVIGAVTDTTAQVSWPPASEDESLQNKLKYTIYYSENRNMSTLDDVKDGTIFGEPNRVGLDEDIITGLEPDTVYYVNVIVTDHNGKESLYSQSVIKTEEAQSAKPQQSSPSTPVESGQKKEEGVQSTPNESTSTSTSEQPQEGTPVQPEPQQVVESPVVEETKEQEQPETEVQEEATTTSQTE